MNMTSLVYKVMVVPDIYSHGPTLSTYGVNSTGKLHQGKTGDSPIPWTREQFLYGV